MISEGPLNKMVPLTEDHGGGGGGGERGPPLAHGLICTSPSCGNFWVLSSYTLQWRHNGHDSVSNHQPHDCLLIHSFRTSKLRITGLCAGNSPGTSEFPAQMASNAENVSIWWRHHGIRRKGPYCSEGHITYWKPQLSSMISVQCAFCHVKASPGLYHFTWSFGVFPSRTTYRWHNRLYVTKSIMLKIVGIIRCIPKMPVCFILPNGLFVLKWDHAYFCWLAMAFVTGISVPLVYLSFTSHQSLVRKT